MEANDAEMEKSQSNFTHPINKNKNDPWTPLESKDSAFPTILAAPQDPLKNIISSESYVKSLEKRLNKIKGKSATVKPKDMIQSLHEARDLHSSQYISDSTTNTYSEDFTSDTSESMITSIQRKLNPERQALNTQELVPLVQEDVLARTLAELDDTKDVQKTCSVEKT
ncbi:uncharacterized protein LOC123527076 isoform X1 [Mercenaria mercenaria]|uniref:uncharacterized protein LOC123527076 isoform X1 n=1 Tax=Mercenaria mercenaria TaxID=6596 RepID=UPI00234FA237|nr:uncharacterized protein LOC123527076 isoform X1 [Mercenaria mercenaria]